MSFVQYVYCDLTYIFFYISRMKDCTILCFFVCFTKVTALLSLYFFISILFLAYAQYYGSTDICEDKCSTALILSTIN